MITNQFRIYLSHFHCSHWLNHLLNFMFREKGPLVLGKTTFSSLFWNKLLIPHANCNGHVPFDMFHHKMILWDFLGEKYLSEQHWQMCHIRLHGCIYCKIKHLLKEIIITRIKTVKFGSDPMIMPDSVSLRTQRGRLPGSAMVWLCYEARCDSVMQNISSLQGQIFWRVNRKLKQFLRKKKSTLAKSTG